MPYVPSSKPPNRAQVLAVYRAERNKALTDTARYVRSKAAKYPPKTNSASYRRTGSLGRSITMSKIEELAGQALIWVGTNLHYAKAVEYGTGIWGKYQRRITPKNAKALAWRSMGKATGPGSLLIATGMGRRKGRLTHRKARDVYMNFAMSTRGMKGWHYMRSAFADPATQAYFNQRLAQMAGNLKARLGG